MAAPTLARERIEVTGPSERGEVRLMCPVRGRPVTLSALEYDIVRRFDGRHDVAAVHALLEREGRSAVSMQALESLLLQLGEANLLDHWPDPRATVPAVAAPHGAGGRAARIEAEERALERAEAAARPTARATEPATLMAAAANLMRELPVDPAEVDALARHAFSRLRAGDGAAAADIMRQAAELAGTAPAAAHLQRWSDVLARAVRAVPAPSTEALMKQLVAAAPKALAALFQLPARAAPASAPKAADTAPATETLAVAPSASARTAPLGAHSAEVMARALAKLSHDPTRGGQVRPAAQALAPSAPAPAPAMPPPAAGSLAWLDGEGTLGLTAADEGLVAQLDQMRHLAERQRRASWWPKALAAAAAVVVVGLAVPLVRLWRQPSLEGVVVQAEPYRLWLAGDANAPTWPHVIRLTAPVDGTVTRVAAVGTALGANQAVATIAVRAPRSGPAKVRRLERLLARLEKERSRWQGAAGDAAGDMPEGWGEAPRGGASVRRRAAARLATAEAQLARAQGALLQLRQSMRANEATVLLPWAGTVGSVSVTAGQSVRAGQTVAVAVDRKLARLAFRTPQASGYRIGDALTVILDGSPPVTLTGHLADIQLPVAPPTGAVDKAARARRFGGDSVLLVDISDDGEKLARASAARLRIVREDVPMAARVPLQALRPSGEGLRLFRVDARGELLASPAAVLSRDDGGAWIRWPSRGTDSAQVVTDPLVATVREGSRVRFVGD